MDGFAGSLGEFVWGNLPLLRVGTLFLLYTAQALLSTLPLGMAVVPLHMFPSRLQPLYRLRSNHNPSPLAQPSVRPSFPSSAPFSAWSSFPRSASFSERPQ